MEQDSAIENDALGDCRSSSIFFLIAAIILFPLLRFLQTDHLLTWDEAMNICSIKAFASLGSDDFSNWFWRHPPAYCLPALLLNPVQEGFAFKLEVMNIIIGMINLGLLFAVNRRLFGLLTASVSIFLLAVMPGSIFFDLWIKRDHMAVMFGLLTLLLTLNRKYTFAALCAGLGFLSKETFLFLYLPAAAMFLYTSEKKPGRLTRSLMITLIPALTSAWWFVIASRGGSLSSITQHINFAVAEGRAWTGGLAFYFTLLYKLTLPAGCIIFIGGILILFGRCRREKVTSLIWPALPLIGTLLILTLIPRKVPWIIIVLLPCVATVQAQALSMLIRSISMRTTSAAAPLLLSGILSASLAVPQFSQNHEEMLKSISPDQYRGSTRSRETALVANRLINDNDRVMLTSFHYWKGVVPGQICPVFTCYLKTSPEILSVPHNLPFEEMVTLICKYNLTWAVVSPDPGVHENDILGGFITDSGLTPVNLGYTCIFDCKPLLTRDLSAVDDEVTESLE